MLREAELFVVADSVLAEVLGRIREEDLSIELPPLTDLPEPPARTALASVREQVVADGAGVPGVLCGDGPDLADRAVLRCRLREDAPTVVAEIVAAAAIAAGGVDGAHETVRARYGVVPVREFLLRLAVNRSLVAHYVAAYLGSTACPLPEELARPLHDLTRDDAARWRALGIFRTPMPVPHLASQRDTFLLEAGHLPHPLGH